MFSFLDKRIKVTFINERTGETVAISKMTPEQLPDGFDRPTTMQIQETEWQVAMADTRRERYKRALRTDI